QAWSPRMTAVKASISPPPSPLDQISSSSGGSPTAARPPSIRARQPTHGEFDAAVAEVAPALALGHVGRLREAAEPFARRVPGSLPLQHEGLAPPGGAGVVARAAGLRLVAPLRQALGHIRRSPPCPCHRDPLQRASASRIGRC